MTGSEKAQCHAKAQGSPRGIQWLQLIEKARTVERADIRIGSDWPDLEYGLAREAGAYFGRRDAETQRLSFFTAAIQHWVGMREPRFGLAIGFGTGDGAHAEDVPTA